MKVRLTHTCHLKGAEGLPGDVVDVEPALAENWFREGGAAAIEIDDDDDESPGRQRAKSDKKPKGPKTPKLPDETK